MVGPGRPELFLALSLLGDTWGLLIAIAVTRWLLGRAALVSLLPLIVLEGATYLVINSLLSIPRPSPEVVLQYERLSISAFPSGHTYLATVLWGHLHVRGGIPLAFAAAVPLGVAVGRLYLGVHHLADLLAGLAFGAGLVAAYAVVWPRLRRAIQRVSTRGYFGLAAGLVVLTPVALTQLGQNPRWWEAGGIIAGVATALVVERVAGLGEKTESAPKPFRMGLALVGVASALVIVHVGDRPAQPMAALLAFTATLWVLLLPLAAASFRR